MMKLKDLAERLGLSQTTVSRALNGYPEVSETTRQRVLEAAPATTTGRTPSARRLATGRAGAIGAVLPTDRNLLVDPHFVEFLAGIGERLAERRNRHRAVARRAAATSWRATGAWPPATRVDALILSGPMVEDERVALLDRARLPLRRARPHRQRGCPTPGSTSTTRAPSATPPTTCSISATSASR